MIYIYIERERERGVLEPAQPEPRQGAATYLIANTCCYLITKI